MSRVYDSSGNELIAGSVSNPTPTLTSVDPTGVGTGASETIITLTGTNFIPSSQGYWEGVSKTTVYISSTTLQMTVPSTDMDEAGTFDVTVVTPSPGGGTSSAETVSVIDNIDLTSSLTNLDAEAGDDTGWTVETGALGVRTGSPSPHGGTYYFYGPATPEYIASQQFDLLSLSGLSSSDVATGLVEITVDWWQASFSDNAAPDDEAEIILRYYDSGMSLISSDNSGLEWVIPAQIWQARNLVSSVPVDTQYVDLVMHGFRKRGSNLDGYLDDITVSVGISS